MSAIAKPTPETDVSLPQRAARLMGGSRVLGKRIASELDAHDLVARGIAASALHHLVDNLEVIDIGTALEDGIGLSRRTYQRTKENPGRSLSVEQSGRAWRFAEVLALATDVMGTQELGEKWLERPALGLDGRRPIDLLATPAGASAVEVYLQQIKHGVYV